MPRAASSKSDKIEHPQSHYATPDELIEDRTEAFERFLSTLGLNHVIVDLDDTESIDSAGVEILLDAQVSMRRRQGDIKIVTSNHVNRKILEITRLDRHMDVFDNVIDAVKSYA